ncbi:MAG: hypothetical protein AB7R89_05970 [Dehalococcoidia bacterium]
MTPTVNVTMPWNYQALSDLAEQAADEAINYSEDLIAAAFSVDPAIEAADLSAERVLALVALHPEYAMALVQATVANYERIGGLPELSAWCVEFVVAHPVEVAS